MTSSKQRHKNSGSQYKMPVNIEVHRHSKMSSKRVESNTNFAHPSNAGEMSPDVITEHQIVSQNEFYSDAQDNFKENYYRLPVEDRNLLWNEAREQKLESIRRMTQDYDLDE